MGLEVVQLKRRSEDYPGDEWLIVNRNTEKPFAVIFSSEVIALRVAELLQATVTMKDGKNVRKLCFFWKKVPIRVECQRCKGKGHIGTASGQAYHPCSGCGTSGLVEEEVEQIDRFDEDLEQAQALIEKEIDAEIGFDRAKDCPDKQKAGACATCPNLIREEILDDEFAVTGERWMCSRRRDEVKVAEKLMENGGRSEVQKP